MSVDSADSTAVPDGAETHVAREVEALFSKHEEVSINGGDGPKGIFEFGKLPGEIRNKIYGFAMNNLVPGEPARVEGLEHFTRTLKMLPITIASKATRDEAMVTYYQNRVFSVQVPSDPEAMAHLEDLQNLLLNRHLGFYNLEEDMRQLKRKFGKPSSDEIKELMRSFGCKIIRELKEYRENPSELNYFGHQMVGKLIVTCNGRVTINMSDKEYNWNPRSFIIGFVFFDEASFPQDYDPDHVNQIDTERQPNKLFPHAHVLELQSRGDVDWADFKKVRSEFMTRVIKQQPDFGCIKYLDALLHPKIQHVIKALCMFMAGQVKPAGWVGVVADKFECNKVRKELGLRPYDVEVDGKDDEQETEPYREPCQECKRLDRQFRWINEYDSDPEDHDEDEDESDPENEGQRRPVDFMIGHLRDNGPGPKFLDRETPGRVCAGFVTGTMTRPPAAEWGFVLCD